MIMFLKIINFINLLINTIHDIMLGEIIYLLDKLKLELIEQKCSKFKGNIYHYSQVNFAYNSNKIEGGKTVGKGIVKKYINIKLQNELQFLYC
ncbi:MAG: hypothetical protein OSJ65_06050 [Bacilli bacterium]|nr:hypothetical protein [Bacilli bacterium]